MVLFALSTLLGALIGLCLTPFILRDKSRRIVAGYPYTFPRVWEYITNSGRKFELVSKTFDRYKRMAEAEERFIDQLGKYTLKAGNNEWVLNEEFVDWRCKAIRIPLGKFHIDIKRLT